MSSTTTKWDMCCPVMMAVRNHVAISLPLGSPANTGVQSKVKGVSETAMSVAAAVGQVAAVAFDRTPAACNCRATAATPPGVCRQVDDKTRCTFGMALNTARNAAILAGQNSPVTTGVTHMGSLSCAKSISVRASKAATEACVCVCEWGRRGADI